MLSVLAQRLGTITGLLDSGVLSMMAQRLGTITGLLDSVVLSTLAHGVPINSEWLCLRTVEVEYKCIKVSRKSSVDGP